MAENQAPVITATQCRMARAALHWSVKDLVEASGVGQATIHRFESGDDLKPSTLSKLRAAFERHAISFTNSGPNAGSVSYVEAR